MWINFTANYSSKYIIKKQNNNTIKLDRFSAYRFARKLDRRIRSDIRSIRIVKLHTLCPGNRYVRLGFLHRETECYSLVLCVNSSRYRENLRLQMNIFTHGCMLYAVLGPSFVPHTNNIVLRQHLRLLQLGSGLLEVLV